VFNGRFDHAIDSKGRVSIPARFREVLQKHEYNRLHVTNFIYRSKRCLVLYPPNEWELLVGKIRQKPSFDPKVQDFLAYFIGGAHEVEVDRQGRILIPPTLRKFALLDKDVTFSAMIDHFQLWDKEILAQVLGEVEKNFENPDFLSGLGV
jgi:transcriptional regulator MraZ